jgi:nucleotide-binding universal stress UspA family protein
MIPRYYRLIRYSGRPDVMPVSEVNPIRLELHPSASSKDLENIPGGQARPSNASVPTPPEKESLFKDRFQKSISKSSDFYETFHHLRSVWDPYEPPLIVQNPLKILAGYDDSDSAKMVLFAALNWAQKYHSKLEIVHILNISQKKEEISDRIQKQIKDSANPQYLCDCPPNIQVVETRDAAQALLDLSHHENVSLLVVGTHDREKKEKIILGSVAENVLKNSLCPVLVDRSRANSFQIKQVLVPLDGTPFSYPALAQALVICQDFSAKLHVLHVSNQSTDETVEHATFAEKMALMNWKNIHPDLIMKKGDISTTIVECSTHDKIDLIIMGTHRLDETHHTLDNSVTAEVVRRAPCSVWVVHP